MRFFDEQIKELMRRIVLMGSIAEEMIQSATSYMTEGDASRAEDVFSKEHQINRLQVEVDEVAVRLAATQQPMAQDVRLLFMASRIASELERIGDQAVNVCQNAEHLLSRSARRTIVDLPIMAEVVQKMVRDSLTAMIERNVELAERVFQEEKKVDAFKDQIFRIMLTYMMSNPTQIEQDLAMILVARNLERIGDHATNVAEEVIYMVRGKDVRHPADVPAENPS